MAPDHASRDRLAALGAPSASSVPIAPAAPDAAGPEAPETSEHPDPEFWGTEPRRVRRTRRAEPDPAEPRWWPGLVDRVRDARTEVGIGVVALVIVALVAGVIWYRMGADGGAPPSRATGAGRDTRAGSAPDPVAVPAGATPVTVTTPSTAAGRGGAMVVVHVAGAVARPGVLLMPAGARVIDAVEGAGGATPDADLDRINLAAKLVDGQRILVVAVGAAPIADPGAVTDPAADPGARIDLNSATSAQLESLPGIGPALAGAIIAERDRRGGFRSINELREVRGIGEARFADLRERVSV